MGASHAGYKLPTEIVALSVADIWDKAKLEWELSHVYRIERPDEPETCLCGHYPIIEVCVLLNKLNGNEAIVGNVCVKKFLGLPSNLIFQAVRRIAKDDTKALNAEAVEHARHQGWINEWEYKFCDSTMRKRKLSAAQLAKRKQINQQVLARMRRTGP